MENLILIAASLGIVIGGLGYFKAKSSNGIFLLSLLAIGFGAVTHVKKTGEIHELSTGIGETLFVEVSRKIGWSVEIFERLPATFQTGIFVFIGSFFAARIIAWAASANSPERKEGLKKRRKRVLKSFGMKNMKDVRSRY